MENDIIEKKARKNIALYRKYKTFSYDFLFYYAVFVLYLTITKGFSMSQVMFINSAYSVFCIIFYFFGNSIVNKLNLKYSKILGNVFVLINGILFLFGNSYSTFLIANFFGAFGFTLKNISESSILYSSLKKLKKAPEFSKIEGKSNSKYYYYDAFASFISGFLFVINNYIPIILCCINLIVSLIISLNFSNVDKQEKTDNYTIKDIFKETKNILNSNRLKALYLFSFIFTGIVTVSTTLYKAILIDVGIKNEYTTVIICIVSIFIGIGAKHLFNIENITRNKTLKFLSLAFVIALFFVGIVGTSSSLNITNMSILLISLSLMGIVQGAYRVALKKYILSLTTHKIRNRITATYYIFENLGSALLSACLALLLNYTTNSVACLIFSIISFVILIFVIYYMKGRTGLRPEQYAPKDINNVKL